MLIRPLKKTRDTRPHPRVAYVEPYFSCTKFIFTKVSMQDVLCNVIERIM